MSTRKSFDEVTKAIMLQVKKNLYKLGNRPDSHSLIRIEFKDQANDLCLFLVNDQAAILFLIPPDSVIAQDSSILNRPFKTKLYPLRNLAHLVLRNT